MSLRIGVDLDGTLANLSKLYREVDDRFQEEADEADADTDAERLRATRADARRHKAVWRALQSIPDLWTRLEPLEEGVVRRLYELAVARNWEVFFITQRPRSEGASVQRQTQQWLVGQGFECPSVLTLRGPRGKAAHALDLDFLVDDLRQNCVDVVSESTCRPILVLRTPDPAAAVAAQQLKIGVVASVHQALDLLSGPAPTPRETMISRVLKSLDFL